MTHQDQLIKQLIDCLESAVLDHLKHPCIHKAQKVARAKHDLMAFIKEAKKNA